MDSTASLICPHCRAPKTLASDCPHCGVIYAKAEAWAAAHTLSPAVPPAASRSRTFWEGDVADAGEELWIRALAIPAVLLITRLVLAVPMFHSLMRIFLSMWVHELGHAVTAWLCGFWAFPGPWFTTIAETRSSVLSLLLAGALAFGIYRARLARSWLGISVACGLLLTQLFLTIALSVDRAQALVVFGGDAGCMVLGTCLMASVYARPGSSIHRGWLRWGFLVIGAAAFSDAFETWWAARTDVDRIPLGMNEGVGLSDPTKLTEVYHWTISELIHRYTNLGILCLVVLAIAYAINLSRARAQLREARADVQQRE